MRYEMGGGGGGGDGNGVTMVTLGSNEMVDQWVWGTNEMRAQWNGCCMVANRVTNKMGDQWDGVPMRWGPVRLGTTGVGNEFKQSSGWIMIWETNEKGTNEMGTNEMGCGCGVNKSGGPMRWETNGIYVEWVLIGEQTTCETNEMRDQWCEPVQH